MSPSMIVQLTTEGKHELVIEPSPRFDTVRMHRQVAERLRRQVNPTLRLAVRLFETVEAIEHIASREQTLIITLSTRTTWNQVNDPIVAIIAAHLHHDAENFHVQHVYPTMDEEEESPDEPIDTPMKPLEVLV